MTLRKIMTGRVIFVLLSVNLGGCLAIPYLNQRSPRVSGVVLNLTTVQPVSGARVEFSENSALAAITDEKGEFSIAPSYKPELLVPLGHGPHPLDLFSRIEPKLRISKEGYETRHVDGSIRRIWTWSDMENRKFPLPKAKPRNF